MLLQVVPLARDIGRNLNPVRQADARDFPKGRVGLLRGHRPHLRADAPLLRRAFGTRIRRCLKEFEMYCRAGALDFFVFGFRPFRTSWLIVGTVLLPSEHFVQA